MMTTSRSALSASSDGKSASPLSPPRRRSSSARSNARRPSASSAASAVATAAASQPIDSRHDTSVARMFFSSSITSTRSFASSANGRLLRRARPAQREPEGGAAARLAVDADRAAVRLDHFFGDEEAEPGAAALAAGVLRDAEELVEDGALVLARDPFSRVGHREADAVVDGRRADGDAAAGRRVAERVAEEVAEDEADPFEIGVHLAGAGVHLGGEIDRALGGGGAVRVDRGLDQ